MMQLSPFKKADNSAVIDRSPLIMLFHTCGLHVYKVASILWKVEPLKIFCFDMASFGMLIMQFFFFVNGSREDVRFI